MLFLGCRHMQPCMVLCVCWGSELRSSILPDKHCHLLCPLLIPPPTDVFLFFFHSSVNFIYWIFYLGHIVLFYEFPFVFFFMYFLSLMILYFPTEVFVLLIGVILVFETFLWWLLLNICQITLTTLSTLGWHLLICVFIQFLISAFGMTSEFFLILWNFVPCGRYYLLFKPAFSGFIWFYWSSKNFLLLPNGRRTTTSSPSCTQQPVLFFFFGIGGWRTLGCLWSVLTLHGRFFITGVEMVGFPLLQLLNNLVIGIWGPLLHSIQGCSSTVLWCDFSWEDMNKCLVIQDNIDKKPEKCFHSIVVWLANGIFLKINLQEFL